MKLMLLLSATLILTSSTLKSGTNWLTNFEQAKSEAFQAKKYILLNFSGSDWCAPCIRLKSEIFNTEIFSDYAEQNLVLANADFPRLKKNQLDKNQMRHNEELAERYNPEGKFPLTILLNAAGKPIKQWDGMPQKTAEQFVEEIKKVLESGN